MEQPTDSSGKEATPNHVCAYEINIRLKTKQAGRIWGSMVAKTFLS